MIIKNKLFSALVFCLYLLCPLFSLQSEMVNDESDHFLTHLQEIPLEHTEDFQTKFFHMLFILTLLIGFMVIAAWALKRMMKTRITQLNANSTIKIVESRQLSPRTTIYILETEHQQYCIAECVNSVTLLSTHSLEGPNDRNY